MRRKTKGKRGSFGGEKRGEFWEACLVMVEMVRVIKRGDGNGMEVWDVG